MAITTTWSVNDMTHKASDGGVFLVYWSCVAASDGDPVYTATEAGKLRLEYDASSPDFIAYADLTEADVLGWVWADGVDRDATEAALQARIDADKNPVTAAGVPW